MQTLKRLWLAGAVAVALVGAGCAGPATTAGSDAQASSDTATNIESVAEVQAVAVAPEAVNSQPANANGEILAARVNGVDITQATVDRAMARYEQQMMGSDAGALREMVLNALIDQALIEQAAAQQNIQVSDAEVQAELDASKQIAGNDTAWQDWLSQNLYTESEFSEILRETLITARMRDAVTQNLSGAVPHVHARHIVVASEAEAAELLGRLRAGEDFATLAAAFSGDVTTRDQGGDLGWFAQGELLEPYLAQVAFSLQPGDLAGPVATTLGFHVIQTLEREDRTLADDKRAALAQSQFEQWLQSLRNQAVIEIY